MFFQLMQEERTVDTERGRGRPAIGGTVRVELGDDLKERIEEWANQNRMPRAEAIRTLLSQALDADHKRQRRAAARRSDDTCADS